MPPLSISSTTPSTPTVQVAQSTPSPVLSANSCQYGDAMLLLQSTYVLSSQKSIRLLVGLTVGLSIGSVALFMLVVIVWVYFRHRWRVHQEHQINIIPENEVKPYDYESPSRPFHKTNIDGPSTLAQSLNEDEGGSSPHEPSTSISPYRMGDCHSETTPPPYNTF